MTIFIQIKDVTILSGYYSIIVWKEI